MKKRRSAVMAVCVAVVASAGAQDAQQSDAETARMLYRQGQLALKEGNADLARQSFTEVLRIDPQNVNARIQLDRLRGRGGEMAALRREHALKRFRIPEVDYDEVTLPEALQALSTMIEKQSEGEFSPNFVVRDPSGVFDTRPVSLQLRAVPANVVLKHLLELADARVRYDAHVIAVSPRNVGVSAKQDAGGKKVKDL